MQANGQCTMTLSPSSSRESPLRPPPRPHSGGEQAGPPNRAAPRRAAALPVRSAASAASQGPMLRPIAMAPPEDLKLKLPLPRSLGLRPPQGTRVEPYPYSSSVGVSLSTPNELGRWSLCTCTSDAARSRIATIASALAGGH
jgi:hypothetical protein